MCVYICVYVCVCVCMCVCVCVSKTHKRSPRVRFETPLHAACPVGAGRRNRYFSSDTPVGVAIMVVVMAIVV